MKKYKLFIPNKISNDEKDIFKFLDEHIFEGDNKEIFLDDYLDKKKDSNCSVWYNKKESIHYIVNSYTGYEIDIDVYHKWQIRNYIKNLDEDEVENLIDKMEDLSSLFVNATIEGIIYSIDSNRTKLNKTFKKIINRLDCDNWEKYSMLEINNLKIFKNDFCGSDNIEKTLYYIDSLYADGAERFIDENKDIDNIYNTFILKNIFDDENVMDEIFNHLEMIELINQDNFLFNNYENSFIQFRNSNLEVDVIDFVSNCSNLLLEELYNSKQHRDYVKYCEKKNNLKMR